MRRSLLLLSLLTLPWFARGEEPSTDPDRWNLRELYASQADWDADAQRLGWELATFAACTEAPAARASALRSCLDQHAALQQRSNRLGHYARLLEAQDSNQPGAGRLPAQARALARQVDTASALLNPQLLAIAPQRLAQWQRQDAALAPYVHQLARVRLAGGHTLDAQGERLLAATQPDAARADAMLDAIYASISWPKLALADGSEAEASSARSRLPQRADRQLLVQAYYAELRKHEALFATSFEQTLAEQSRHAAVRHYPDTVGAFLGRQQWPAAAMDAFINQAHAGAPTLHRLLKLRASLLGLPDLQVHDLAAPLARLDQKFTLPEAKALMLDSARPLGADYAQGLRQGLAAGWMDALPRPGKSPAFFNYHALAPHPYVIANFSGSYGSVQAMTHEWGHAMMFEGANRHQASVDAPMPLLLQEVAAQLHETLLEDLMIQRAASPAERLYYLCAALNGAQENFFQSALDTEFERELRQRSGRGETLGAEGVRQLYARLRAPYWGEAQGVVQASPDSAMAWTDMIGFAYFNDFARYAIGNGRAVAALLAQSAAAGDASLARRYAGLLNAGGSKASYAVLKDAGVDLAGPAAYQALLARMNRLMDQVDTLRAER